MGRGTDAQTHLGSKEMKKYTWEEVEKHRSMGDAWVVVNGKVSRLPFTAESGPRLAADADH
jgi:hypothetical protein